MKVTPLITKAPASKENKLQGSPEINTIPTFQNKDSDEINLPKSQLNTSKEGASLKELPPLPQKECLILTDRNSFSYIDTHIGHKGHLK